MKKQRKWRTSLLTGGLGLATVLVAVPTLTACSSGAVGHKVTTMKYNVVTKTKTARVGDTTPAHPTKVFPASINTDAQEQVANFTQTLSVGNLQYDFNRALTDFFDVYEAELKNGIEIEIDNIKVMSRNNDQSFKLKVSYEVEKDRSLRDSDEVMKSTELDWTPKFTTMTYDDIAQLTQTMRGYRNSENQNGIDIKDLKELFLGEKDDDDFDFDDDDDDIGIFDKLGAINKDYANQSSIVAYELTLAQIFDPIVKAEGSSQAYRLAAKASSESITKDTPFQIPSLSLNSNGAVVLVPNEAPSFKFTSILSGPDFDAIFNSSKTTLNFQDDGELLNKVFTNATPAWKESVEAVAVNKDNGTLIVQYKDTNTAWEEIVIARQFSLTPKA